MLSITMIRSQIINKKIKIKTDRDALENFKIDEITLE